MQKADTATQRMHLSHTLAPQASRDVVASKTKQAGGARLSNHLYSESMRSKPVLPYRWRKSCLHHTGYQVITLRGKHAQALRVSSPGARRSIRTVSGTCGYYSTFDCPSRHFRVRLHLYSDLQTMFRHGNGCTDMLTLAVQRRSLRPYDVHQHGLRRAVYISRRAAQTVLNSAPLLDRIQQYPHIISRS